MVSCSSVSEQIKTTNEHICRVWVTFPYLSRSEPWWEWLNIIQKVSCSLVSLQIRITNKLGWTCVQAVSCSPVFEQIPKPLMRMAKHVSSLWATVQCLSRSEPLTRTTDHTSSLWVTPLYLSRWEPLMGMAKHASRKWVTSQCWADQIC